jgi:uncharacterized protein YdhG (YjbR/CyaY superfamily)
MKRADSDDVAEAIDDYFAKLDAPARAALQALRKQIQAAAPRAEEVLSYGVPAFRQDGMLVSYGATARHCAFYVMSGSVLDGFAGQLDAYDTSKGTIRFQPAAPLPAALVKRIVAARLAENAAAVAAKAKSKARPTAKAPAKAAPRGATVKAAASKAKTGGARRT